MNAVIVGAGLVGPVIATLLAQRGMTVEVFERNEDFRSMPPRPGKSINITLATRGLAALEEVGIADEVKKLSIPVFGRIIHNIGGQTEYQPYGNNGECLYSISRHRLARCVADLAERSGVKFHFAHKCVDYRLVGTEVVFERDNQRVMRTADLLLGADGARSALRTLALNQVATDLHENLSDHANMEIRLSPEGVKRAGLVHEALHIWPRGDFMVIAFPNLDGSFTCTLHLPKRGRLSFESLKDPLAVEQLFDQYMPDLLPCIPDLAEQVLTHPIIPMITIRCGSWVFGDRTALMGDAAHSVWPSYGQGANCGFEDCLVLARSLDLAASTHMAIRSFELCRKPQADAIADLSEQHFREIRDQVGTAKFMERKRIERLLNQRYSERFVPLYNRVSFSRTPYTEAISLEKTQRQLVDAILARSDREQALEEVLKGVL